MSKQNRKTTIKIDVKHYEFMVGFAREYPGEAVLLRNIMAPNTTLWRYFNNVYPENIGDFMIGGDYEKALVNQPLDMAEVIREIEMEEQDANKKADKAS